MQQRKRIFFKPQGRLSTFETIEYLAVHLNE